MATAETAVVEQAARAQRAAPERSRGLRRRSAVSLRERGLARGGAPRAALARARVRGALLYGITAADVKAMCFLQHNYPAVSIAPYFLQRILAG